MMSSMNLPPVGVQAQNVSANRCARLEQICPHGAGLYSDHLRLFDRIMALKVDQIENLALPRRQLTKEVADETGDALAVDARAVIGVVNSFAAGKAGV